MFAPRRLLALAGSTLAAALPAQSTLLVGPGGFAQIDPAIQAARPGDTILIAATDRLDPFSLDRGVTIRTAPGFRPYISNPILGTNLRDTSIRIPTGQTAELVGLDFTPPPTLFGISFHASVAVTAGTVSFRDCNLIAGRSYCGAGRPALTVTDADVALQDCRLYGVDYRSPGLAATRATLSLADCWLRGGIGCHDGDRNGMHGIMLAASSLHACRLDVAGGRPVPFYNTDRGGHGILIDATSRLWLSDSLVAGGDTTTVGLGGDALHNLSATPMELRDVTLVPGAGATRGGLIVGPSLRNPALTSLASSPAAGPITGGTYTLDARSLPNALLAFGFADRIAPARFTPFAQPLWITPGGIGPVWIAGRTDAIGRASHSLSIPSTPAIQGRNLWCQAVALDGARLQLSPLRGGQVW